MHPKDLQRIKKAKRGNKKASAELYQRHEAYWFGICLRYGRDRTEAQDIFQEGVMQIFQHLGKFNPQKGNFKGWSNTVLIHQALKYLKKHQWEQSFNDLEQIEQEQEFAEHVVDSISAKELTELIQRLPTGYRLIFNMYEIEGYSHKEIAAALNISIGHSKSQLSKANNTLQKHPNILFYSE